MVSGGGKVGAGMDAKNANEKKGQETVFQEVSLT